MRKGCLSALAVALLSSVPAQAQSYPQVLWPASLQVKEDAKPAAATNAAPAATTDGVFCGDPCASQTRFWIGADYLVWWIRTGPNVPLVTTGDIATDPTPGALGQPGTVVLFGNQTLQYGTTNGIRFSGAYMLQPDVAIEGNYFYLEQRTDSYSASSDASGTGSPFLARPITDTYIGFPNLTQDALMISAPGASLGLIDIVSHSRLQGGEINGVFTAQRGCNFNLDLIGGFRYLNLAEDIDIFEGILPLSPLTFNGVLSSDPFSVNDRFAASNHFYGGQLGARVTGVWGDLSAALSAKVALGWTDQNVDIQGSSTLLAPGGATVFPGGVLAVPGNIGSYSQSRFAVVPEIGVNLAYRITPNVTASIGYSFMYWSSVVRPGSHIDPVVDQTLVPSSSYSTIAGPGDRPRFHFDESDFWAHGLNFGLGISF